jgi:Icc-related predicted phosphoesterase
MLKILAFGDLLGKTDLAAKIIELPLVDFDVLLFTGDIPNPQMFKDLRMQRVLGGEKRLSELMEGTKPPEGLKKALREVEEAASVFEQISEKGKLYGVLGNADLLYYTERVDLSKGLIILHKRNLDANGFHLIGYSGRPAYLFEKANPDEQVFTEQQIYDDLSTIFHGIDHTRAILVTHCPPHGILDQVNKAHREYAIKTYGDKAVDGHIGSLGLRKVIDEFCPTLHVFGHIHESKGVYFNDQTIFINTGSLGESFELVNITYSKEKSIIIFESLIEH